MNPASLMVQGLTCHHGAITAVDNVSLDIKPGEHVALIGANGSGKTTLLRAVLGFHRDRVGQIVLDGRTASRHADWRHFRKRIAWIPQRQTVGNFPLLLAELLASSGNRDLAEDEARRLGLGSFLNRPVHTLSGGQMQRGFMARALGALSHEAGLLLADEPTAALDFDGQLVIAEDIAGLPATVLVVTHDRAVASRCHRIMEMAGGIMREVRH